MISPPGACASASDYEFDQHASQYEAELQEGLRLSGEGPEYFARHRIAEISAHPPRWQSNAGRVAVSRLCRSCIRSRRTRNTYLGSRVARS